MNYLRGAVSAISAPYHYYNQINPSTLTGAIDIIVVHRPTNDGQTELACSPFHVRFGKWQVLRPSDKRVNISVNGEPIPFNMKIGEAGEAFFVFETEDDVPEDLITSPILLPTRPETDASVQGPAEDRVSRINIMPEAPELRREGARPRVTSEPEFLDLDAGPGIEETPKPHHDIPQYAHANASTSDVSQDHRTPAMVEQDKRVDKMLENRSKVEVERSDVEYHEDVALDMKGYHASEQTPRSAFLFPSVTVPTPPDSDQEQSLPSLSSAPSSLGSSHEESFPHLLPPARATSEPPPDTTLVPLHASTSHVAPESSMTSPGPSLSPTPPLVHSHPRQRHVQEYSWEWGAFPTPSPLNVTFPSSKGKEKMQAIDDLNAAEEEGAEADNENERSDSDGKSRKRRRRRSQNKHKPDGDVPLVLSSGRIRADEADPTRYILEMEGHEVGFELGVVGGEGFDFHALDTIEATRVFEQAKVPFQSFLDDGSIVRSERLVIRWAGSRYTTRKDDTPLISVLEDWRTSTLQHMERIDYTPGADSTGINTVHVEEHRLLHARSMSEPPEEMHSEVVATITESRSDRIPTKSSKLSWSWWSRSRKNSGNLENVIERPALKGPSVSAPPMVPTHLHEASKIPNRPGPRPVVPEPVTPHRQQFIAPKKKYVKTLRLTSDQLKTLNLKSGANSITFSLSASGVIACTARIFVWEHTDKVVISDIDGTITKSDGLGHVFAMIGRDWTHLGVAKLYTDIVRNGYKIMYLTSRAIGQADATRYYLKGINQNDYKLPEGPVVMSPDRLMASLHREVIMRKPEVFKMACLRDIRNLFGESRNPFYAGFGNRITDALSYRSVKVPSSRIFTIDSSGEVKLELLELAGYKSSYIHMTDLVDQLFPPINQKWTPEYTDFNFWRTPVPDIPLPDLTPPSPALSARSDTSTKSALARLRNFSLVGSRSSRQTKSAKDETAASDDLRKNVHARQMTSLERLSSSLVNGLRRSISPDSRSESSVTYAESDEPDSDAGEWEVDVDGKKRRKRKRERRRSIGSMPGSLDDMHFFGLDDYEEEEEPVFGEFDSKGKDGHHEDDEVYGDGEEVEEDDVIADEQAFEEDLFVAGEMKNVPFL